MVSVPAVLSRLGAESWLHSGQPDRGTCTSNSLREPRRPWPVERCRLARLSCTRDLCRLPAGCRAGRACVDHRRAWSLVDSTPPESGLLRV